MDNCLIDRNTKLKCTGKTTDFDPACMGIKSYDNNDRFQNILAEYPDITNPNATHGFAKVNTFHYIETTGPPVFSRPRRLSPEKLTDAKRDFELMLMLKQGICRLSKSPWSLLMRKKNPTERGDYVGTIEG